MSEATAYGDLTHRNPAHDAFGTEPLCAGTTKRSVNQDASSRPSHQTVHMRFPGSSHRRLAAAAIGSVLVVAACGGSESSSEPTGSTLPPPPDAVELDPAADTSANQLPDVVVDDVIAGNKVNLRNVAPADTPILLWMYAPH